MSIDPNIAQCEEEAARLLPWFIAGSLAQCRIYSKYLGLQIKACELGLLSEDPAVPDAAGLSSVAA